MDNAIVAESQKTQQETLQPLRPPRRPRDYQQINLYRDVNLLDLEDWKWQLRNRICNKEELAQVIKLTSEEE